MKLYSATPTMHINIDKIVLIEPIAVGDELKTIIHLDSNHNLKNDYVIVNDNVENVIKSIHLINSNYKNDYTTFLKDIVREIGYLRSRF